MDKIKFDRMETVKKDGYFVPAKSKLVVAPCASHPCEIPVSGNKGGCKNCAFAKNRDTGVFGNFTLVADNSQYACKLPQSGGLYQNEKGDLFLKVGDFFYPKEQKPNSFQQIAQLNTEAFILGLGT